MSTHEQGVKSLKSSPLWTKLGFNSETKSEGSWLQWLSQAEQTDHPDPIMMIDSYNIVENAPRKAASLLEELEIDDEEASQDNDFEYEILLMPTKGESNLDRSDHDRSKSFLKLLQHNKVTGVVSDLPPYHVRDLTSLNGVVSAWDIWLLKVLRLHGHLEEQQQEKGHFIRFVPNLAYEYQILNALTLWERLVVRGPGDSPQKVHYHPTQNWSLEMGFIRTTEQPQSTQVRFKPFFVLKGEGHHILAEELGDIWGCGLALTQNVIFEISNKELAPLLQSALTSPCPPINGDELGAFIKTVVQRFGFLYFGMGQKSNALRIAEQQVPLILKPIIYVLTPLALGQDFSEKGVPFKTQVWFRYYSPDGDFVKEVPALVHKGIEHLGCSLIDIAATFDDKSNILISSSRRDLKTEKHLIDSICQLGLQFRHRFRYFVPSRELPLTIIYRMIQNGWEVWAENTQVRILQDFTILASDSIDWLEFSLNVPGMSPIAGWQLVMALKRKSLFIRLDDGTLGILPEKWFNQLSHMLGLADTLGQAGKIHKDGAAFLGLNNLAKMDDGAHLKTSDHMRECLNTLDQTAGLLPLDPPKTLTTDLRRYQRLGLAWLSFMHQAQIGVCLADDMGLGKTVQVLAFLEKMRIASLTTSESVWPFLLVVPKTLVSQWRDEAARFAPELKVEYAGKKKLQTRLSDCRAQVVVTTYGVMRSIGHQLTSLTLQGLILDEAQMVKNPGSMTHQALRSIPARWRLALTGTPFENHWHEFFGLFFLLNPGLTKICSLPAQDQTPQSVKELLSFCKPLVLRRVKSQVLEELPAVREESVFLDMPKKQGEAYESIRQYCLKFLDNDQFISNDKTKMQFLEGLLRLRQIACHTGLVFERDFSASDLNASAKLTYLKQQIPKLVEQGRKTIIFSQFTMFLRLIADLLRELKVSFVQIDGKTHGRSEVVKNFQSNQQISIMLASLRVGGIGLNLTAADTCILTDPWWNPAVERQAIDRINRIGQKKSIEIYKIYAKDSIEEKMLVLQKIKEERADQVMHLGDNDLLHLSKDDFDAILSRTR